MPLTHIDTNLTGRMSQASNMSANSDPSKTMSCRASSEKDVYNAPGVMSMLRASTEIGDVGSMTLPSSRMPGIPRPAHRRSGTQRSTGSSVHSASASQSSRSYRPMNSHQQGMFRGPPRPLQPAPLFFSSPTRQHVPRGLPMPPHVGGGGEVRSYSMTHTSRPLHGLPTQRSLTSLRSQGLPDRSMNLSPQSAYKYPVRARRSHQRNASPTFSDVSGYYPYTAYRMDAMRNHYGRRVGTLSPPPMDPADLAQLPRGPQPMRSAPALHERERLPLPRLQPDQTSSSPPPSPLPPTPRDSKQAGSVVVGIPPSPLHYDRSVLTSPTTYYDYTEEFSTTEQSGGDDASGLAAGFVHRIRTIIEEKAGQEEVKRKQFQQESQKQSELSETETSPDVSEIAAAFELPNSSPVSNRITRDMVAAALETSFDDADETKGINNSGATFEERAQKKANKTSISTQESLAGSTSLLHSSFIQDEKSDKLDDSSTELKDSTFTDGPSSVWEIDSPTQGSGDLTVRFSLPPPASQGSVHGQDATTNVTTTVSISEKVGKDEMKGVHACDQLNEKRNSATVSIRAPTLASSSRRSTPPKELKAQPDSLPSTPTTTVKVTTATPQGPRSGPAREILNKPKVDISRTKTVHPKRPNSKYSQDDDGSDGSPGTAVIRETSSSAHVPDVAASKQPIIKIIDDPIKPAEPAQNGTRTMADFFNSRRSQTRPFSAVNESETFKRLSQGCQQDDHLSDVKEESREDISTTDLSSFKFPMPWHANRKQPKSRPRSRSDISPIARNNSSRQSAHPTMPRPLAETRTIPSLNFSRLDLVSKLNEALEAQDRSSRSLDTRRSKSYGGIHAPVPERALSSEAMRERYKSFFAADENFGDKAEEEQVQEDSEIRTEDESGSGDGPKLKRTASPVELIYELDRLSIPSVNPLTARLSRLMPSLRNHKSWEHVLGDEGFGQTIEDIRQLGDRRTPNLSSYSDHDETRAASAASFADLMQKAATPSFVVSAPNLMKDLPPLPGSRDSKTRPHDGPGIPGSALRRPESANNLEAYAMTAYRPRSKAELSNAPTSPREHLIARASHRSLRHRSSPFNRPWNLEESYPWDDSAPPIDISLPATTHRWEPSSCRPSRLRQYGSISTTGTDAEPLVSPSRNALSSRLTNTPKPSQSIAAVEQDKTEQQPSRPTKAGLFGSLKVKLFGGPLAAKKIVKRNLSTPNFRHQSPLASHPVVPNVDGFATLPTVLSVSDELSPDRPLMQEDPAQSSVNPGDRYPTSALSPPSAFNLSEVRSFFSDDSSLNGGSQRKNRRDRPSLGKRLTTHLRSRVRSPSGNALKPDVPPVPKIDLKLKNPPAPIPTPTATAKRRTRSADDCRTPQQSPHDAMQRAATSPNFDTGATNSPQRRPTKDLVRVASQSDRQDHAPKQSQELDAIVPPPRARTPTPVPASPSRTHRLVERLRRLWLKSSGFLRHLGGGSAKRSQKKEEDREWNAGTDIEVSIEELPNARMVEAQDKQTYKKESIEPEGVWGKVVKKVVEGSVSVEGSGRDSRADTSRDSRAQTPRGDRDEIKHEHNGDKTPTQSMFVRQPGAAIRPATAP